MLALIDVNRTDLEVTEAECAAVTAAAACSSDANGLASEPEVVRRPCRHQGTVRWPARPRQLCRHPRDGMLIKGEGGALTEKMSLAQWQSVIDVNLTGTFLCGREGAALMATGAGRGVIINISSIARAGNMGQSNYAASKAGWPHWWSPGEGAGPVPASG